MHSSEIFTHLFWDDHNKSGEETLSLRYVVQQLRLSPRADFFCLVALYPAADSAQRRELGTWWAPQILLFSKPEMRNFLRSVRTVGRRQDKMFGFGFNPPDEVMQTRGDAKRGYRDFSPHLLPRRIGKLREFLSA